MKDLVQFLNESKTTSKWVKVLDLLRWYLDDKSIKKPSKDISDIDDIFDGFVFSNEEEAPVDRMKEVLDANVDEKVYVTWRPESPMQPYMMRFELDDLVFDMPAQTIYPEVFK